MAIIPMLLTSWPHSEACDDKKVNFTIEHPCSNGAHNWVQDQGTDSIRLQQHSSHPKYARSLTCEILTIQSTTFDSDQQLLAASLTMMPMRREEKTPHG